MESESADNFTAGNLAAQEDEIEVLQSIYGQDCIFHKDNHSCEVFVHPLDGSHVTPLHLCVYFPDSYPSTSAPILELQAPWLLEEIRQRLSEELHKRFMENLGNAIVFSWVEWLKEQSWLWEEAVKWTENNTCYIEPSFDEAESRITDWKGSSSAVISNQSKNEMIPSDDKFEEFNAKNLEELDAILGIIHGASFTEKKSTFQAHLASVSSVDQVETVMEALMRNRKIAGATHNIMAYRISIPEKNTILQDYDDDGETAAGGRLLHLLQIVDAINVVVVVSRWFGGILLGPDRFKHINNCARSLLDSCGYIKGSGQSGSHKDKHKMHSKGSVQKGRKH